MSYIGFGNNQQRGSCAVCLWDAEVIRLELWSEIELSCSRTWTSVVGLGNHTTKNLLPSCRELNPKQEEWGGRDCLMR